MVFPLSSVQLFGEALSARLRLLGPNPNDVTVSLQLSKTRIKGDCGAQRHTASSSSRSATHRGELVAATLLIISTSKKDTGVINLLGTGNLRYNMTRNILFSIPNTL